MHRGKSKAVRAQDKFEAFYSDVYATRWEGLKKSMADPAKKVALWNAFTKCDREDVLAECHLEAVECALGDGLKVYSSAVEISKPPKDEKGVPAFYLLDLLDLRHRCGPAQRREPPFCSRLVCIVRGKVDRHRAAPEHWGGLVEQ